MASPCTGAQRNSLAPTFTWGLSCSTVRRDLWSRWAQMPQCSDSCAPGPCVCSTGPPAAALAPSSPVPLFLGVGRFLGPVSAWKFWVPQGTPTSSLVLDEPPWLPARPDPLPASFYSAIPRHSSPFILPWPSSSGHPGGRVRKRVSASLLASLCGQPRRACRGLCAALTVSLGKPRVPAPGVVRGGEHVAHKGLPR